MLCISDSGGTRICCCIFILFCCRVIIYILNSRIGNDTGFSLTLYHSCLSYRNMLICIYQWLSHPFNHIGHISQFVRNVTRGRAFSCELSLTLGSNDPGTPTPSPPHPPNILQVGPMDPSRFRVSFSGCQCSVLGEYGYLSNI